MVGVLAIGVHGLSINLRCGAKCIAVGLTRYGSHVAVLARNAFLAGWSGAVLLVDNFQGDTWLHYYLMAASAERTIGELFKLDRVTVNRLKGPLVVWVRFDFVVVRICDDRCDAVPTPTANDRVVRAASFDASFAVNATVAFDDSVASDAGNPFSKNGRSREDGGFTRVIGLSGNRCVAARAKRACSTSKQIGNRLFEALEHGRDCGISMAANAPLIIDFLMAFCTSYCRWVLLVRERFCVWVDGKLTIGGNLNFLFLPLLLFCSIRAHIGKGVSGSIGSSRRSEQVIAIAINVVGLSGSRWRQQVIIVSTDCEPGANWMECVSRYGWAGRKRTRIGWLRKAGWLRRTGFGLYGMGRIPIYDRLGIKSVWSV